MTSKQRATLRGLANKEPSLFQVGKGGISSEVIKQVEDALRARELIKLSVLETSPQTANDIASELADSTDSAVVAVIGRKIILYKRNPKKPVIKI